MTRSSSPASRRKTAVASFSNAAETIDTCEAGMSLFAITRGQWSMIDAVLHVLDQVGPAAVSLWTWTIAEYGVQVQVLTRLQIDKRVRRKTFNAKTSRSVSRSTARQVSTCSNTPTSQAELLKVTGFSTASRSKPNTASNSRYTRTRSQTSRTAPM